MKATLFLFLFLFYRVSARECFEEFENLSLILANECCKYPFPSDEQFVTTRECTEACNSSDWCCAFDCPYTTQNLYENGEFQRENFINVVKNSTDDDYRNQWKEILDQSIEKCEKLCEFQNIL